MGKGKKRRPNTKLYRFFIEEKSFVFVVLIGSTLAAFSTTYNWQISMWIGFIFAAYSAVANDSIQTIGTFIESNFDKQWWKLWLFIGGIFLVTITYSYIIYDGDITYQRLLKPDGTTPYPHPNSDPDMEFSFFQVIAPLVLLVLTRFRMPVSTTFLLLSAFSASSSGITSVVLKSVSGYFLAFVLSFLIWILAYNAIPQIF